MEKFLENIYESERILAKVGHMVYVTYPIVKDKKLLIQMLLEIKTALAKSITAILQYEYYYKRITLSKSPKENLRTFKTKCASKYNITFEEMQKIFELFDIIEKHNNSPFEFKKEEKIVILSETLNPKIIEFEEIKGFLALTRVILEKTKNIILQRF